MGAFKKKRIYSVYTYNYGASFSMDVCACNPTHTDIK